MKQTGILVAFIFCVACQLARAQTFGCTPPLANAIVCENSKPGNSPSEWDIGGAGDPSIQGFATDISVNQGQVVHFKVTTNATAYRIDIYRLGYYAGNGARKVASILPSAHLPQNQPACKTDSSTALTDCGNWSESASWSVPTNATSGIYIAKLVRSDTGGSSHMVFVVRADSGNSQLLFQTSDTTWQAYNTVGGASLYTGGSAGRAYKVSYNRPYNTRSGGSGPANSWLFDAEYPMVRWLEANGYDVSYFTGVDSDRNGSMITRHKVFLSVGHDEYWSGGQRANVEAARAAGIHLAFFSGNESFWKTRWENSIDGSNTPYRTLVCYKETHAGQQIDPLDPPTWTGTWRDPRFSPPADGGRPENALTGTIFQVNGVRNDAISVPAAYGSLRFWRNTAIAALSPGTTYTMPTGTLGYEWDQDPDNGFRPAGLFDLSSTTMDVTPSYLLDYGSNYGGGIATHSLTLYRASSGALVFGAGTTQWSWGLDANHDNGALPADPNMQQATVNLFADMGVQPATIQPGLVSASQSTDTVPPVSTITFPASGANIQNNTPITITGAAAETDTGVVAAVEVSIDGGATWHRAVGLGNWSYTWTPFSTGSVTFKSRAVDDSANLEVPSAGVTVNVVPDTTPPIFSNVQAGPVTNSFATITWTTNKSSDTQVDYGTTSAYGASTTLDSTLVTNHSAVVAGLAPTTLYHYRVKSRDLSGNLGISGDFTFTTTNTNSTLNVTFDSLAPNQGLNGKYPSGVIDWGSGVWFLSGPYGAFANNSISFTGPNQFTGSFSFLSRFRLLSLDAYNGDTGPSTVTLSCPGQANKQVTIAAGQLLTISTGWNDACSPVTITTTNSWFVNFNNLIIDSPPVSPPVITNVQATGITCSTATVTWTTNKSATSQVDYGLSSAYTASTILDSTLVTSHSVLVAGLAPSTLYHYRADSKDSSGTLTNSGDFTFTTSPSDPNGPAISGVQAVAVTDSSAYITWTTDKVSTTQVDYGVTTSYGTSTALDTNTVTTHWAFLSSLSANTVYHYRVDSRDICGNLASSTDFSFGTSSPANTIWSSTASPSVISSADNSAVELGVKFRSDVNGYITGIRFYKGAANTGTHVGNLWNTSGTLLASATFRNETASGWQQINFAVPVAITANTVYVASYHTNVGAYSDDQGYFASTGFDNAPLHVPSSGTAGGNDVYQYGSASAFPTQSYSSSNYWVDVLFVSGTSGSTTAPVISAVQAVALTNSSAYIIWNTDVTSDSQVEYGTSTTYGNSSSLTTAQVTSHSVMLSNLTPTTVYHYRVKSRGGSGLLTTSVDFTFTTTNAPPSTLWSSSTVPTVISSSDTGAVELGIKFTADVNGYITGVRFYKGSTNTGAHVASLWTSSGTLLARANFTNETASGWQQANFSAPVAINANTVYVASYHTNVGGYSDGQGYFAVALDNPPLHAPSSGASGGNDVYQYGSGGFPSQTYNQSNYWVDVVFVRR